VTTIDMGRKQGGCCAPFARELGPHLTQCRLGRGNISETIHPISLKFDDKTYTINNTSWVVHHPHTGNVTWLTSAIPSHTFPYLGSLITEDGECMTEFRTRLNRGQAIGASLQKIWKSHSIPISTKIRLMKALVWPVVTYGCQKLDTQKE